VAQLAAAYRQFGLEPYWSEGTRQPVREAETTAEPAAARAAPANLRTATQLIGLTVRDSSHQEVGEIRDFVLDLKSGRILYAVLAQGGILGVADKLYPIPPLALSFADAGKSLALNTTRDQLGRAPQFTGENPPSVKDPKWAADVYAYYHAPMYWRTPPAEMNKGATELMRQPVREPEAKPAQVGRAPAASPLATAIMDAFQADPVLAPVADRIQIIDAGGVVTLMGEVNTAEQKETAARVANIAAGVTQVENQITVRQ
jgi:hypothetical protein